MTSPQAFSLLWPPATDRDAGDTITRLDAACSADLGLSTLVDSLAGQHRYRQQIAQIMGQLCQDPAAIRYRQDILADLVDQPDLADRCEDLLPRIITLDNVGYSWRSDASPLHEIVWRTGQLEAYVDVVGGLSALFDGLHHEPRSEGLRRLHAQIVAIEDEPVYQNLHAELPDLLRRIRGISSVTLGVNLDEQLRPAEATLLAINDRKFRGPSSLYTTLFGRQSKGSDWDGIAPLHTASRAAANPFSTSSGGPDNPLLHPLFRDLADVLKQSTRPLAAALKRYIRLNTQVLGALGGEMAFYLGATRLVQRLRAEGLPMCRPELVPAEARICQVEDGYNLNLALRFMRSGQNRPPNGGMVTNTIAFGPDAGQVFILTGPNQGGKTTYTQAVGLIQVMAQAGLFVPGRRAHISPVDGIFTHFPAEERPESEAGRLGEEAQRLNTIFTQATRHSLVLLNESLASTSPGEAVYLARDIVRILRRLGTRAIYATHLHELATDIDQINRETPGDGAVASLVSLAGEHDGALRQTYRIVPGPPRGRSYAQEIAARYGISYEQLDDLLRKRGLVDGHDE